MISFMGKNGNTAIISIVSCEQSRINAALNGGDIVCLDSMLNDINKDPKITHCLLRLTYGEDEKKVLDFYNDIKSRVQNNQQQNNSDNEEEEQSNDENNNTCCSTHNSNNKAIKQKNNKDFICPECGSNDALVDKDGNKYPCLSCIQIDIGKKLQDKYSKEYTKVVDKNNNLIEQLIQELKK